MKTKKLTKAVVLFTVLALVICMAQTAVFAENTVSISNGVYENGNITVTGSINKSGAYMNILAIRTSNQNVQLSDYATNEDLAAAIVYMDQVTATSDNFEKTWTFPVKDTVEGNWVVVFVSGTEASAQRLAIELDGSTPQPQYENGTFALVPYSGGRDYYLGGTQDPAFTLTGDDAWKEQLEIKVYWTTVEENATIDKAAGTITMAVPQTVTTYIVKANNTSTDYPAFSVETSFKYVSAAGAEFKALPADLGVVVNKADDKYTITVPANTSNVTFTATVDGEAVDAKTFDVVKGDAAKTVVVTATAPSTLSKSYTVTVPAREASGEPEVSADAVEIITDDEGEIITDAYKKFLGNGKMIVTIDAGDIDPDAQNVKVGGVEFFYVATRNYFVGIVPATYADEAAIADAAVIADGASDFIVYGKDPIEGDPAERLFNGDYAAIKKIALGKVDNPTDKQLLSSDVSDGVMDGLVNNGDYAAVKKVALRKAADLDINNR